MAETVLVKGKLVKPDATAWPGATVSCTFANFSTTSNTQHPPARLTTTTAADGSYSFLLWVNELGDYDSHYLFKFPNDQKKRKVIITSGTPAEVEISELLLASTDPGDPNYPSLIALINGLFAAGDFSSTADLVPLNPAIPGLGASVQSALGALKQKSTPYRLVFSDADLSLAGVLVATHDLDEEPSSCRVYLPIAGDLKLIEPEEVDTTASLITINFDGFRPLPSGCLLVAS